MTTCTGRETVKGGYYLNVAEWKLEAVDGAAGTLSGGPGARYVRVPMLALLVVAPLLGLVLVVLLPFFGQSMDLGPIAGWGLGLARSHVVVTPATCETNLPGVFAIGDVATYPGKLKLIASGFSEAAIAVNQAVHWIYPEKKVNPGHSSNLAVFGQKDD